MLTCNAFSSNTVGSTQQTAACKAPHLANLSDHELLPEQFMLLVLDSLRRLGLNDIEGVASCDFADALRNASCAMLTNTPAFSLEPVQLQAQILFLLNESLCGAVPCTTPSVVSATINADGTFTVVFSETVTGSGEGLIIHLAPDFDGFPTYVSGSGTNTFSFTPDFEPIEGEDYTLQYDSSAEGFASGDCPLETFTGFAITNNTPP